MRRTSRRTQTGTSNGEQGFWPSYTDMMSAVALILFFLMLLAYIQNIITNNDLSHKEEELRDTLNQLIVATQQVKDKEAELQTVSDNLETAQQDLDQQKITLDQQASSIIDLINCQRNRIKGLCISTCSGYISNETKLYGVSTTASI